MTRVLVTNDDGVESAGIRALAGVGVDAGLEVVVAAPTWDSSGASASLTAVEAAPAFIVRAGLRGAFGELPDVVLSGINAGANTGSAVLHSGTVGAVLTATSHGCRGLAVSIATGGPLHWATAAAFARRAIEWLLGAPAGLALNLNVPNLPEDQVAGLVRAHLSTAGVVQTTVTELGKGYVKLTYTQGDGEPEPGSDSALLAAGFACITPLVAPCEARDVDTAGLVTAGR